MNPESGGFEFDLDDLRARLARLRAQGALRAFLETLSRSDLLADVTGDVAAELERMCRLLAEVTSLEVREPGQIAEPRLKAIARATGVATGEVLPLLRRFISLAEAFQRTAARLAEPEEAASPPPVFPRIDLFELQPPPRRAELRYRWDLMARVGHGPAFERPVFDVWKRDLRLWDFLADPRPNGRAAGGGAAP